MDGRIPPLESIRGVVQPDHQGVREILETCLYAKDLQNHLAGSGHSVYFRDPAGSSIKLASPRIWNIEESTLV